MIDKNTLTNRCARVNFDPGENTCQMRNKAGHRTKPHLPKTLRQAMQKQRMDTGIAQDDLEHRACGRITTANRENIVPKAVEHQHEDGSVLISPTECRCTDGHATKMQHSGDARPKFTHPIRWGSISRRTPSACRHPAKYRSPGAVIGSGRTGCAGVA